MAKLGYSLGIDLGTSATAAAISEGGRVEIFDLGAQGGTMPSLVLLRDDGEALVGEAAERRAASEPARVAREFKRRFGDPVPIVLGTTPFGADALVARVWAAVVARATERLGAPPDRVALTHPASYGPYKMELLQQAARQAGIERPVFLTEPESAAIQYAALERIDDGALIAVYDFGGGTFDATILRKQGEGFQVLGEPEGLERLGGADFDDAVLAYVVESLRATGVTLDTGDGATRVAMARLRDDCRVAKEALSEDTEASIAVMLPGLHTQVRLTRGEFERMVRPRISETTAALQRAVRGAGLEYAQIDRVVLVGGSSRIPLVAEMVGAATGRPVAVDVHPKQVVAMGAARVAALQPGPISVVPTSPEVQPAVEPPGRPARAVEDTTPQPPAAEEPSAVPVTNTPVSGASEPVAAGRQVEPASLPTRTEPTPATTGRGGRRGNWFFALLAAGVAVLVVIGGLALSALFGGGGAALAAEIEDIELDGNQLTVTFTTEGFEPSRDGSAVAFYWEPNGVSSATVWTSASAFDRFALSSAPAANARICVVVIDPEGSVVAGSGSCRSL